ncbi:MAG TPA: hypothetical protein VFB12_25415 [Ktedonobacteraceae bacterium]|nr:hypothetical protein [Ktedonobacteraceae bacterium]
MEPSKSQPSRETVSTAKGLLEQQFGGPVRLGEGHNLRGSNRSKVYRFSVLDGPSGTPTSVIVKQAHSTADAVYDPNKPGLIAWTFFNEWASLQFLSHLIDEATGLPFSPRFYGGDRTIGVLVMEDLGDAKRMDHYLLADDPAAAEILLVTFAATHGRLHALMAGLYTEFTRIRDPLGAISIGTDEFTYEWFASVLYQVAETVGITPAPGVDAELAVLKASMQNPGPFLTFFQRDSCPGNCLYIDDKVRLIDFEGGMLGHALVGGVYGRIHFPTCSCVFRMPERIPLRMEAAYRAELIKGCPAAADDTLFYRAVVEACAFWMLDLYQSFPLSKLLQKDFMVEGTTVRQRLLMRSELLMQATEEFRHLEAIGATVQAIATKLRDLWPEAAFMPYYPAFRS